MIFATSIQGCDTRLSCLTIIANITLQSNHYQMNFLSPDQKRIFMTMPICGGGFILLPCASAITQETTFHV